MKTILVVTDYYLPGYKGGGPIRTLANLIDRLGGEFAFSVLARDRDLGSREAYPEVVYGRRVTVGAARVRYLAPVELRPLAWARLLRELEYDLLYLNSFFASLSARTMLLRRAGWIPRKPLLLAPRGEFNPGALKLKGRKKQVYLALAKTLGVYEDVLWQASSAAEQATILREFPPAADRCMIAPNLLSGAPSDQHASAHHADEDDRVRIVFLSRIAPMKNLDFALRLLAGIAAEVDFDIYGPLEDRRYWEECRALIDALPPNVRVEYRGEVHPAQVAETLAGYHLLFLPTRGENFGHVIWEALAAGCPVLTSDQTPWNDLEWRGAGWALPLSAPERFVAALGDVVNADTAARREQAQRAREYAAQVARDDEALEANRRLFCRALGIAEGEPCAS
jgi:glycosyltransferase involved in cell wall biosynthesis